MLMLHMQNALTGADIFAKVASAISVCLPFRVARELTGLVSEVLAAFGSLALTKARAIKAPV